MNGVRQRNICPVPSIIVTSDVDEANDGENPKSTQPDISQPFGQHIDTHLSPHDPPHRARSPKFFWDGSIPIRCPSITSTSAATTGSESIFSPLLSISSRSSLDARQPFDISKEGLCKLFEQRDLSLLRDYGGIDGIARRLASNCTSGLGNYADLEHFEQLPTESTRRAVFGSNTIPDRQPRTLWVCTQEALQDPVALGFLLLSSVIMALSFLRGEGESCIEAAPGFVVLVVAVAGSVVMAWIIDRNFVCTLKTTTEQKAKVVRGGSVRCISVHDIMVGDVICLEQGDLVLADGLLISGRDVKCDESCVTGESEPVTKAAAPSGGEWDAQHSESLPVPEHCDPFLISGSSIIEGGAGRCLVTGVGIDSTNGRLMQHVRTTGLNEQTPLQQRVASFTSFLMYLAVGISALFFLTILVLDPSTHADSNQLLKALQMAVIMVLVSAPEGLPMSVAVALIFAWRRGMFQNKILFSKLSACETMGNVTAICCDKTGTLTMNEMEVAAGVIGSMGRFSEESGILQVEADFRRLDGTMTREHLEFQWQEICPKVRDLLVKSAAVNSTALESVSEQNSVQTYLGSGTETAFLRFVRSRLGLGPLTEEREKARVVESIPFDSRRKCMATVTKVSENLYRMYVKGAPEILLEHSDRTIQGPTDLTEIPMTRELLLQFTSAMNENGSKALRMLGLAYRDFPSWPPPSPNTGNDLETNARDIFTDVFRDLVFFGLVGICDPLRPGVKDTVAKCQGAGIAVRLVTGDSKLTAAAVALECGILGTSDSPGLVMEGKEFRKLLPDEMSRVLPKLRVLARSIPEDKKLLVSKLKELGETVAATGDGTNDGPALRAADVGIALGNSGTDVAKEASSVVLLDDDFASIVEVIALGRSVYDAVRRFLQFQLTANLSVLVLSATFAIRDGIKGIIFTLPEMMWINLIMDLLAAVALSTDGPDSKILNRPPEKRTAPLLSCTNYKMIISQAAYQFLVVLAIMSAGKQSVELFEASWLRTLASNTYIFMLFFNLFNSRSANNNINILEGVHKNMFFVITALGIVCIQVLWISFGGEWLQVTKLSSPSLAFSAAAGFLTIPFGVAIRYFSDTLLLAFSGWVSGVLTGLRSFGEFVASRVPRLTLGAHVLNERTPLLGDENV